MYATYICRRCSHDIHCRMCWNWWILWNILDNATLTHTTYCMPADINHTDCLSGFVRCTQPGKFWWQDLVCRTSTHFLSCRFSHYPVDHYIFVARNTTTANGIETFQRMFAVNAYCPLIWFICAFNCFPIWQMRSHHEFLVRFNIKMYFQNEFPL